MGMYRQQRRKQELLDKQRLAGMAIFALGLGTLGVFYHCNEFVDMGAAVMMIALGVGLIVSKKCWIL